MPGSIGSVYTAVRSDDQAVNQPALYAACRDWVIAQIPGGGLDLDPMAGDGKPWFARTRSRG
ncbi:MAG: hypothetical protein VKI42_02975 [Synechococcaceae cyanobacterium]|nr:hypothetical protein [Synechococcaceae cyanobacterium]